MIKKLLLTAAIVAPLASANEAAETCGKVGELAVNVYDARQYNVPADEAFEAASESAIAMAIVREAYTMPRWRTDKHRNSNRVDFKSKWVLWCYDTFDGENK